MSIQQRSKKKHKSVASTKKRGNGLLRSSRNWLTGMNGWQRVSALAVFALVFVTAGTVVVKHAFATSYGPYSYCRQVTLKYVSGQPDPTGTCVTWAQDMINGAHSVAIYLDENNYYDGSTTWLNVDGDDGPLTNAASYHTKRFFYYGEGIYNVTPTDGIIGPNTWTALCGTSSPDSQYHGPSTAHPLVAKAAVNAWYEVCR